MTDFRMLLGSGVALAAAGVLAVGLTVTDARGQMKPCCDAESIDYAKSLWSELEKTGLAGAGSKPDEPYKGQEPHGFVLETITSTATVNGHTGKVVVKRNYGPEGVSVEQVEADRSKHLAAVTVMFKRESGYDSDNSDWFWAKFKPDGSLDKNPKGMELAGRVMKGADQGCIACHSAVKDKDYLFGKQN